VNFVKSLSFDAYTLKIIAVVGMIGNHVAIAFAEVLPLPLMIALFGIGGLTYVIMAYFVVEGYKHTSSYKKYIGRLFLFAIIAQAFHPTVLGVTDMTGSGFFLNILFAIIWALIMLKLYDTIKIRPLFWVVFVLMCFVSLFMDLMFFGLIVPVLYYAIKKENTRRIVPGVVVGIYYLIFGAISALTPIIYFTTDDPVLAAEIRAVVEAMGMPMEIMLATPTFALGAIAGAILIRNFNGERGKRSKWLFYVVYPAHLAVIAVVMWATGLAAFNLFGF